MKKNFLMMAVIAAVLMGCSSTNTNTPTFDTTQLWPAMSMSGEKWGFIDAKGTFVVPPMYDQVSNFSCGYALVRLGGSIKYIDKNNKVQGMPSMDWGDSFYNNFARFTVDGKYGLVDKSCKATIQPIFSSLDRMGDNGLIGGQMSASDKYGYYDKDGKNVIQPMFDYVDEFKNGGAVVRLSGKYGVIDKSGKWLISASHDRLYNLGYGLIGYELDGKYGIMNLHGDVVVQPIYSGFMDPMDNNLIAVRQSEKWGYIDFKGNPVISEIYCEAEAFYEGYAWVKMTEDGAWMLINTKGEMVLSLSTEDEPEDEPYTGFHNGLCKIFHWNEESGVSYRYIDIKGSIVYTWTDQSRYYAPSRDEVSDHGAAMKERTLY